MEPQRRTFISYSRSNKEFVVRLAKELRAEGFPLWLDILDIPAGSRWDREVEKALKESEIFMIILTQASAESENVLDEIGYAIDHHKRIMPVLLEKCEVPLRLTRFQYVDFTNKNFDEGIEAAKDLLKSLTEHNMVPSKDSIDVPRRNYQHETGEAAKSKTDLISQTKEDTDHMAPGENKEDALTRQRVDEEPAVNVKAEPEKKAKEKVKLVEVSSVKKTVPGQKKPLSNAIMYGIGAIVLLSILSIVFSAFSKNGNSNGLVPSSISTMERAVTKLPTKKPETIIYAPTDRAVVNNTATETPQVVRYDIPTAGFPTLGPVDAVITIVEFSDYQCPFCRRWHQEVYEPLMAAYPGKIRLVYRNLPLTSIHPDAQAAAEAAMCAGEQGAYWPFHNKLFNSESLDTQTFLQYAQDLSLNVEQFQTCIATEKYKDAIQTDSQFARNLGVQSTPMFFINGLAVVGAQPLDVFQQVIDKELAGEFPP